MTAPWQRSWLKSKNNPLIFVRDVLGATPEPWQAEALEAVGKHDRVSIRSGHGVGKTTLEAWLILWFLLTRQNCKVPVAANSQDQLRDTIWPEIAKWHRQLPDPLKAMIDVQAERIVVVQDPEGAFAVQAHGVEGQPRGPARLPRRAPAVLDRRGVRYRRHRLRGRHGRVVDARREGGDGWKPDEDFGLLLRHASPASRHRWHTMHVSCLDVPTRSGAHRGHQGQVRRRQQRLSCARAG